MRVSIIKGMVFVALIDDIFCGAAMDSMEYVMAKGHDVLTIGLPGSAVAKQGGCCLDSRGSKHYGLDTSTIMARMTIKTCRVMCKDMMNMSD